MCALLVAIGCRSGPSTPSPGTDAVVVHGTERLAWSQTGYVSGLRFRAYVDDTPAPLDGAVCEGASAEAVCSSPLPPMADGSHTITLVSVLGAGAASERSEPLFVEKVSGSAARLASIGGLDVSPGAMAIRTTLQLTSELAFDVDVIARGIHAPAQMATTPDGRLMVAEGDGSVRIVRPDEPWRTTRALEAGQMRRMLAIDPGAAVGLAVDPDFARSQFVYVAALFDDGSDRRVRIVRMREVGDTLGDPAALFEATVASDGRSPAGGGVDRQRAAVGPRLAFGPDKLLYIALPEGYTFDREPLASRPHASMLRLRADGLAPDTAPLTGVRANPLAFTWDPSTRALWLAFADRGVTTLEPAGAVTRPDVRARASVARTFDRLSLPSTLRHLRTGRALFIGNTSALRAHELTQTVLAARGTASTVRLAIPVAADGLADRLGDFVSAADGTWYATTDNGERDGDVIVRLKQVRRDAGNSTPQPRRIPAPASRAR